MLSEQLGQEERVQPTRKVRISYFIDHSGTIVCELKLFLRPLAHLHRRIGYYGSVADGAVTGA